MNVTIWNSNNSIVHVWIHQNINKSERKIVEKEKIPNKTTMEILILIQNLLIKTFLTIMLFLIDYLIIYMSSNKCWLKSNIKASIISNNSLKNKSKLKVILNIIADKKSHVGENSIPICADITKFNFDLLIKKQLEISQTYFDVIMMDPPWKLSSSQPSRGVAIQY